MRSKANKSSTVAKRHVDIRAIDIATNISKVATTKCEGVAIGKEVGVVKVVKRSKKEALHLTPIQRKEEEIKELEKILEDKEVNLVDS